MAPAAGVEVALQIYRYITVVHSDDFYMEQAERSLQAPPSKCRKAASPSKCRKSAPLNNASKQLPLKNAASKYAVNAPLLKNAVKQLSRRCHVMSK